MTYVHCPRCRLELEAAGLRIYECPRCAGDGQHVAMRARPRRLFDPREAVETEDYGVSAPRSSSPVSSESSVASASSASP